MKTITYFRQFIGSNGGAITGTMQAINGTRKITVIAQRNTVGMSQGSFTINGATFTINEDITGGSETRLLHKIDLFCDGYGKEQEFTFSIDNIDLTFIMEVEDHS